VQKKTDQQPVEGPLAKMLAASNRLQKANSWSCSSQQWQHGCRNGGRWGRWPPLGFWKFNIILL